MKTYTIEVTQHVPQYQHLVIAAETMEEACKLALADRNSDNWLLDYECTSQSAVTSVWEGQHPYDGPPLPLYKAASENACPECGGFRRVGQEVVSVVVAGLQADALNE